MARGRPRGISAAATVVAAALVAASMPLTTATAALERDRQALVWDQAWAGDSKSGIAVALTHQGRQAFVGSPFRVVNGQAGAGSVTVFSRSDDEPGSVGWRVSQAVTAPDVGLDDWFGASVATDAMGTTLLVGIPQDDVNGSVDRGRAALFVRSGGSLQFSTYLSPVGGAADDRSGSSVALSDDGATAVVGSPGRNGDRGSATVFTRAPDGSWQERRTLTRAGGQANDRLGARVALSGDGTLAVAGVPGYDIAGRNNVGAAVPYTRGEGAWTEGTPLTRFGAQAQDALGQAVAVSQDGSYVVVGMPGYSTWRGAAVVFHREREWVQQATLIRAGGEVNDQLGWAVAVSDDGGTAVVGAPYVSGAAGAEVGVLLQYARTGTSWIAGAPLVRANAATVEHLGTSAALSADGQVALGGAPDATIGDRRSGAAVSFVAGPPRLASPAVVSGSGLVGTPLTPIPPEYEPAMPTEPWFWLSCGRAVVADDSDAEMACIVLPDPLDSLVPTADLVGRHVAIAYRSESSAYVSITVSASVPIVDQANGGGGGGSSGGGGDASGGAPVDTIPPTLSGRARAGRNLTTSTGTWDPAATTTVVTWWRCTAAGAATSDPPADCTVITGAGGTTYRPGAADLGTRLRARVVGGNAAGVTSATTATSEPVVGVWAKRVRVAVGTSYHWRRLAGTGSDGNRKLRKVTGPCHVSGRRLQVEDRGTCVVKAVVTRRPPYPKLVQRIRLRSR